MCRDVFQLFYLVTESYTQGNLKEMRKWAYEIHSTFLVEKAVSQQFAWGEAKQLLSATVFIVNEVCIFISWNAFSKVFICLVWMLLLLVVSTVDHLALY